MRRTGSTLIEMIVTLAVMAVVASVVAVTARPAARNAEEYRAILDDAARRALRLREPVTVAVPIDGRFGIATFFPDGSAVGDSGLAVDRLSGGVVHAR